MPPIVRIDLESAVPDATSRNGFILAWISCIASSIALLAVVFGCACCRRNRGQETAVPPPPDMSDQLQLDQDGRELMWPANPDEPILHGNTRTHRPSVATVVATTDRGTLTRMPKSMQVSEGYNVVNYKAMMGAKKNFKAASGQMKVGPVDPISPSADIHTVPAFTIGPPAENSKGDTAIDLKRLPSFAASKAGHHRPLSPPPLQPFAGGTTRKTQTVQTTDRKPLPTIRPLKAHPSQHKPPVREMPQAWTEHSPKREKMASVGSPHVPSPRQAHPRIQGKEAVGPAVLPSSFFDRAMRYTVQNHRPPHHQYPPRSPQTTVPKPVSVAPAGGPAFPTKSPFLVVAKTVKPAHGYTTSPATREKLVHPSPAKSPARKHKADHGHRGDDGGRGHHAAHGAKRQSPARQTTHAAKQAARPEQLPLYSVKPSGPEPFRNVKRSYTMK